MNGCHEPAPSLLTERLEGLTTCEGRVRDPLLRDERESPSDAREPALRVGVDDIARDELDAMPPVCACACACVCVGGGGGECTFS
jgi:hypothetical protein